MEESQRDPWVLHGLLLAAPAPKSKAFFFMTKNKCPLSRVVVRKLLRFPFFRLVSVWSGAPRNEKLYEAEAKGYSQVPPGVGLLWLYSPGFNSLLGAE